MSFNRLSYDTCAYSTEIKESVKPLEYNLYKGKFESCKECSVGDFTNNLEFSDRTEVENELFGLTRQNTKCPSGKYDPKVVFKNHPYSPPTMCQSVYNLTPTNLQKINNNMISNNLLGMNSCKK
jgi:hypothetical protein